MEITREIAAATLHWGFPLYRARSSQSCDNEVLTYAATTGNSRCSRRSFESRQTMELEVFQVFKPKLVTAISDSVLSVASNCRACGLIDGTYEKIVYKVETPTKQATLLVDAVEKCIRTDDDNFEKFMAILDEQLPDGCKKPLSDMREKLKSMRDRTCTDEKMTGENSVVDVPKASYSPFRTTLVSKQKRQKDTGISVRPGRSNSSKSLARSVSTDSGISVGRSDSVVSERDDSLMKLNSSFDDLTPIEEIPLDDQSSTSTQESSTTCPPIPSGATISDRMWGVEQEIRNLRLDAMQQEAVVMSLKDEIHQLREELDRTVDGKRKTEKELRFKRREITKLTNAMECEKSKFDGMTEEVDGLKGQLSDSEVRREKLKRDYERQINAYKDDILAYEAEAAHLKAVIEEKDFIIRELRSKMFHLERTNVEVVLVQRSNSHELREEIQEKDTKLHEKERELCRYREERSKEQNDQLRKECIYVGLIGLLVVAIAIVVYMYVYHKERIQCVL